MLQARAGPALINSRRPRDAVENAARAAPAR